MFKNILKWLGVHKLLEAVLEEFNLPFLFELLNAFLERWRDNRLDNQTLTEIVLASAAKAEVYYPDGHGWDKYEMVVKGAVASAHRWVKEEVDDVEKAFGSFIDDAIQLAHARIERVVAKAGNSILGAMAAKLDDIPEAFAVVKPKE